MKRHCLRRLKQNTVIDIRFPGRLNADVAEPVMYRDIKKERTVANIRLGAAMKLPGMVLHMLIDQVIKWVVRVCQSEMKMLYISCAL